MSNKAFVKMILAACILLAAPAGWAKDAAFIDEDQVESALGGPVETEDGEHGQSEEGISTKRPVFRDINMGGAGAAKEAGGQTGGGGRKRLNLYGIKFRYNSSEILPESHDQVNAVGRALSTIESQYKDARFKIVGHTCDLGSSTYNLKLSLKRAKAVERFLSDRFPGLRKGSLQALGRGEEEPLVANTDEPSRAKNRRVEIVRAR